MYDAGIIFLLCPSGFLSRKGLFEEVLGTMADLRDVGSLIAVCYVMFGCVVMSLGGLLFSKGSQRRG